MAESLTDAVVSAVETAKAIIAKYGCWPFHHAPERLRDDLEALARYVRGSSSLASRAAEFRGLYATPPEPIGGPIGDVHAASYHELGRDLATWILDDIIDTAKSADGDSCPPENWDRSMSKEQLDQIARQWPAVQTYLRDPARQFDCILLVTSIRDEAAKAARSRTGRRRNGRQQISKGQARNRQRAYGGGTGQAPRKPGLVRPAMGRCSGVCQIHRCRDAPIQGAACDATGGTPGKDGEEIEAFQG